LAAVQRSVHEISVVVPVYRGELTLPGLVERLAPYESGSETPNGVPFRIAEVMLVHDQGPDRSDLVIHRLADEHEFVRPVWLMRNSGQHGATAAGIASSGSEWIVTLDEDGQHDPDQIGRLLDAAIGSNCHLVYGINAERTPHPWWRNATSSLAKRTARVLCGSSLDSFTSFRLIDGTRARAACAFIGSRTFLDIALTWTIDRSISCPVTVGTEGRTGSGYRLSTLLSHFWTLVLSSGTRPLRLVSLVGFLSAVAGITAGLFIVYQKVRYGFDTNGWASVFVAVVVMGGANLFALGIVAEYVGAILRMTQGRPAFVIGEDPAGGALHLEAS
jgi:polyisoprenyl-phosphate glycosyltransferase